MPSGLAAISPALSRLLQEPAATCCSPPAPTARTPSLPRACCTALGHRGRALRPDDRRRDRRADPRQHRGSSGRESPGSITMEVQDVPAIAAAAQARGVPVAIDNTYGAGVLFDAFAAGVDISIQALTKYVGGHSDVLLGSIATRDVKLWPADCASAQRLLGHGRLARRLLAGAARPEDARRPAAARSEQSALTVARWLDERARSHSRCFTPPSPTAPATRSGSATSPGRPASSRSSSATGRATQVVRFVDALELFKIGYSWGGAVQPRDGLCATSSGRRPRPARCWSASTSAWKIPPDLIADLEQALDVQALTTCSVIRRLRLHSSR